MHYYFRLCSGICKPRHQRPLLYSSQCLRTEYSTFQNERQQFAARRFKTIEYRQITKLFSLDFSMFCVLSANTAIL